MSAKQDAAKAKFLAMIQAKKGAAKSSAKPTTKPSDNAAKLAKLKAMNAAKKKNAHK